MGGLLGMCREQSPVLGVLGALGVLGVALQARLRHSHTERLHLLVGGEAVLLREGPGRELGSCFALQRGWREGPQKGGWDQFVQKWGREMRGDSGGLAGTQG